MVKKNLLNISEHFLDLEKRISKVRFARIEASKRLKIKNQKYSMVTSLYGIILTFIAIVFSVVNFTELNYFIDDSLILLFEYQKASVIILAFSSFTTMLTLYIANKGYGEKAARFQSNYMELTRLHSDIKNFMVYYHLHTIDDYKKFEPLWKDRQVALGKKGKDLEKRLVKKYRVFADKYAALLTQSENHEDIDYQRACKDEIEKNIKELKNNSFLILNYQKIKDEEERLECIKNEIKNSRRLERCKFLSIAFFPVIIIILVILFKVALSIIGYLIS